MADKRGKRKKNALRTVGGEERRVSSITRRLHRGLVGKKFWIAVRSDLLLALCSASAYLAGMELAVNGSFALTADRILTAGAAAGSPSMPGYGTG